MPYLNHDPRLRLQRDAIQTVGFFYLNSLVPLGVRMLNEGCKKVICFLLNALPRTKPMTLPPSDRAGSI